MSSKTRKSATVWKITPPADIRKMVDDAIRKHGGTREQWISECIKAGLKAK